MTNKTYPTPRTLYAALMPLVSTDPYHPAYGLPDDYRRRVLWDAEIHGVKHAATKHCLSETAIYKWLRAYRKVNK